MKLADWKLFEVSPVEVSMYANTLTHKEYTAWSIVKLNEVITRELRRRKGKKIFTQRGIVMLAYRQNAIKFFQEKLEGYGDV